MLGVRTAPAHTRTQLELPQHAESETGRSEPQAADDESTNPRFLPIQAAGTPLRQSAGLRRLFLTHRSGLETASLSLCRKLIYPHFICIQCDLKYSNYPELRNFFCTAKHGTHWELKHFDFEVPLNLPSGPALSRLSFLNVCLAKRKSIGSISLLKPIGFQRDAHSSIFWKSPGCRPLQWAD